MSPRFPDGLVIQKWFMERIPQMPVNSTIFSNGTIVAACMAPIFRDNDTVVA